MESINYLNLFDNFEKFYEDIQYNKNLPNVNELNLQYSKKKIEIEQKFVKKFINSIKNKCNDLKYDTNFQKMVDNFNNFYENYIDDLHNDHLTLQNFTCMISSILKNFNLQFKDFITSYGFDNKKLNDIYDPSIPFDTKINYVQNALSSDFLSRTIFHYDNKIKYITKGANGGVNLINVKNGLHEFNIIEKYMLKNINPINSLFSILREYIIGTQLLYRIRKYTPNFTSIYGFYVANDSIPFTLNISLIDDYLKNKRDNLLSSIVEEYIYNGYYFKDMVPSIANIDNSNKTIYLLTEYSKGDTFTNFIENVVKTNNVDRVFDIIGIFAQIYRSLILANGAMKYVHNDLHCSNILIYEQTNEIYVPELSNLKRHNSQKVKYLAQIIDYGYSSIQDYEFYSYKLFSNEKTTIHTDILRLYTSMLKKLTALRKAGYDNQTIDMILKYTTICIGSYYFKDYNSFNDNTDINLFKEVLIDYDLSNLYGSYEYLSESVNQYILSTNSKSIIHGFNFYFKFVDNIYKLKINDLVGFRNVSPDKIYDYEKLKRRDSYIPVNDMNLSEILNNIQPDGLTQEQYNIIKNSFLHFSKLCNETISIYNDNDINLENKISLIISFCHCIINFSKYIALNTFLIYYTKKSNIIPEELINIFDGNIIKEILIILNYIKKDVFNLPSGSIREQNLRIIDAFEKYFQ